jgi:anti-sigma factor (TIGR02949 family)
MPPMLDCDAVMRQLWDYLDEELTPARMAAIREHLALCQCCQPHADFERAFLAALARARGTPPVSGKLRIRVMSALRAEGFAATPGP